jgi:hypothetical protein
MPSDNNSLKGLLGLGKGGGGGGGHHHHHGGRGGGGFWGPGYYWGDPILVAEDIPGVLPQTQTHGAGVGAKVYKEALRIKTAAEHGDNSLQEAWNGTEKQVLHEPDLPKATEGFMWAFTSGPSKKTGETANWIMYVRTGQK